MMIDSLYCRPTRILPPCACIVHASQNTLPVPLCRERPITPLHRQSRIVYGTSLQHQHSPSMDNLRLLDRIHRRNDFESIELLMLIFQHLKFRVNRNPCKTRRYLHLRPRRVCIRVKIAPIIIISTVPDPIERL